MANANGWGDGASNNNIGWGQGADNAIGWGAIHADSWAGLTDIVGITTPPVDPDAQAFITAAAITDPTQQAAINTLVVDLKGYNVWSKMKALYPFVGGTSSTHKWNLKDPRDLDAAFRLQFINGWTHSVNGATPNGTDGYADTKLNDSILTPNSSHLSYYSRSNVNQSGYDIGLYNGTKGIWFGIRDIGNVFRGGIFQTGASGEVFASNSNSQGYYLGGKNGNTTVKLYKNGTSEVSVSKADATATNTNVYLATLNQNGTPAFGYSTKQCAFASIGDGLNDTEAANLYTAVQTFQTTLGRSIGTQTVSDADAQAFVTAANIQDQVEANAINNLVIGMKADGLWTKMKAVYPFVGGTASQHKWNLKDPRDLDAAFRLQFINGWTHSSTGATPNGTDGYADTKLTPSTSLTLNDTHLSFYSRTDGGGGIDIGATAASDFQNLFIAQGYFGNFYADSYSSASRFQLAVQTKGLMTITRTASNSFKAFKNATQIGTTITSVNGTLPNWNIFLGATNRDGAPTNPTAYSARNQAFATIGTGLTDTDVTNLNTRVTTFQTALNRNV